MAMACVACCAIPLLAVAGIAVAPVGVAVAGAVAAGAGVAALRERRRRSAAGRQGPFVSADETRTIR